MKFTFEPNIDFDSDILSKLNASSDIYSSVDGDDGDEESVEYEGEEEEIGGIDSVESPKFRKLVRNKKLEMKAQYGKGHFSIGECGIKPLPAETILNTLCAWDCSKDKNKNKDCCAFNRNQAEKRAERRKKIAAWEQCRKENKGIWVSGWRKKWKEFKRSGGLAQLKMQAKGLLPTSAPVVPTTTTSPDSLERENTKPSYNVPTSEAFPENNDKKFLWMPRNIGIPVSILGIAAIGFGVWFVFRNK